jgi:hypothetical protein
MGLELGLVQPDKDVQGIMSTKKRERMMSEKESRSHEWSIQIKVEICTNLSQIKNQSSNWSW